MVRKPIRVLLVDDDQDDYLLTRDYLLEIPGGRFEIDWVSDYDDARERIASTPYDVYLVDHRLGPKRGLELVAELSTTKTAPFILLTGQGEWELDYAAMRAGAVDFLDKSRLDATLLERSIRYALQQKRSEAELESLVQKRTVELERTNAALQQENAERRRAEQALREADRRKDEFIATLAHELRNPLAPIRNALEIMRLAGNRPQALEQARNMMDRQVRQMVRLIDDLLDVSRITRGRLQLVPEKLDLANVLDAALEIGRPAIEKAGLQLEVKAPKDSIRLVADKVRLAQVFSNLLNNAAKFTETGGKVTLTSALEDGKIVVRVRDTGIGIPPEKLPSIFELFNQVHPKLSGQQSGLGLGLAIVQRLTEMHGGSVEAYSEGPGKGSEFVVRLPAHGMSQSEEPKPEVAATA
jgi:signal transduction histidine kinase